LAAASKESAWILPLALLAYLWTNARDNRTFREVLRSMRWFLAAGGALMLSGACWVYFNVRLSRDHTIGFLSPGESFRYLLSEVQVIVSYLRLLAWPSGLSVDHDFKASNPWSPYGLYCLLLLLGLLVSCLLMRKSKPTPAFLGLTFFVFLAPTSSILPSADLMFEHRLYLPMIAASGLLAWGIISICARIVKSSRIRLAACAGIFGAVLLCYSVLSRERTLVWGDDIRLWSDAVAKAPFNSRAHYNLGVAYLAVDKAAARREFTLVAESSPNHAAALYNLGWIDQSLGRYDSAEKFYLASLKYDVGNWQAHQNLGNVYVYQGRIPEGMTQYRETIRTNPKYWPAYRSLAELQIQQGYPADALSTLEKLKELQPHMLEARCLKAHALVEMNRFGEARAELHSLESEDTAGIFKPRIEELRREIKSKTVEP
jgi:Tfp pilus assembly protein PilF